LNTFDVRNINYRRQTSSQDAQLVFDLRNSANNQTSHCNMTSSVFTQDATNSDTSWVSCDNGDVMNIPEAYNIKTLVQFNKISNYITLNQTWYCDEINPEYP
jgi:hypothetical protein